MGQLLFGIDMMCFPCELSLVFFQNEEIFVQLDELDEFLGQTHPRMNRIQLQPHTSTENILV